MIYSICFLIIVFVFVLFGIIQKRGMFKGNYSERISGFMKFAKKIHEGENTNIEIVNNKVKSISKSLIIKYNFSTEKGILYDKALEKKYKIFYIDGNYNILNPINDDE